MFKITYKTIFKANDKAEPVEYTTTKHTLENPHKLIEKWNHYGQRKSELVDHSYFYVLLKTEVANNLSKSEFQKIFDRW